MKKYFSLTILLLFTCTALWAQTKITGQVKDVKSKPIKGANVSLSDSYDGATTDSSGFYSFSTTDTGTRLLSIEVAGFRTTSEIITLTEQGVLKKDFILKERINELNAVTITAGVLDQKKISVLNSIDMVTVAGSSGDVIGALKTLPGTQQANDREGLFVRGGTGAETQQFIDGLLVRNAFLTGLPDLGTRGRFSPFLFKGTVFSSGGYSALYGQALSGAINLESIDLPEQTAAFINLSSVGLGGGYQHLNKKKTASFGGSYNWTNLTPYFLLVKQDIDYFKAPDFHTADANFRIKTSSTGMLKFYAYGTRGNIGIRREFIDSYQPLTQDFLYKTEIALKNDNVYTNLNWTERINQWKLYTGVSYSTNSDEFRNAIVDQNNQLVMDTLAARGNIDIDSKNSLTQGRVQLERRIGGINTLKLGTEAMYFQDENTINGFYSQQTSDLYNALFAEVELYINNSLGGKIGVRADHNDGVLANLGFWNKWRVAPRLSLAYRLGNVGEFSAAAGIFYQKPEARYLMLNPNLDYMKANHYILNYTKSGKDRLLRVEGFYKTYDNLIKTTSVTGPFPNPFQLTTAANNDGYGHAGGAELYFRDKRTFKGLDYWISYSYLDTKRDFLYYPIATQPDFVAKHNASIVIKKFWTSKFFGINATYSFASGRPYFNPNSYFINGGVHEESFMQDRTMDYHNLSLSANYLKRIGKAFTVFVLSVSNVPQFKQVYGYNYSAVARESNGNFYRQEIKPPAPMFVFLGVFMSFGIDRSQEAIDANL